MYPKPIYPNRYDPKLYSSSRTSRNMSLYKFHKNPRVLVVNMDMFFGQHEEIARNRGADPVGLVSGPNNLQTWICLFEIYLKASPLPPAPPVTSELVAG